MSTVSTTVSKVQSVAHAVAACDAISQHKGLVRVVVLRVARPTSEADTDDAMQAGSMGLLRALEDYDPARGAFSTYAAHWIRAYVQAWDVRGAVKTPRGLRAQYSYIDDDESGIELASANHEPDIDEKRRVALVKRAWSEIAASLPPKSRAIAEAVLWNGKTTVGVAARFGCTPAYASQVTGSATKKLKNKVTLVQEHMARVKAYRAKRVTKVAA